MTHSDLDEVFLWRGRDVNAMSREELIAAVKALGRLYSGSLESMRALNATWSEIAKCRVRPC